ncbi:MAG TPA: glycosyltransferase family 4 protein [Blastocatellia bacterium]|nr:glycosyltransferase family 4 protein [Blastocatellia bacterium]
MRVGLMIYGDPETLTGGFLYDRQLVAYLREQGDFVEIISLPWRNYGRHLADNLSPRLWGRLRAARPDVLIQDELTHPSVWMMNRWLKRRVAYPIVTLVHLLRGSESHAAWRKRVYQAVERQYFKTVDGAIFNSQTTREAAEQLTGREVPGVVAYPASDHLRYEPSLARVAERAQWPGPLRVIFVGNVLPGKGLDTLIEALRRLPPDSWRLKVVGSLTMDRAFARRIREQIARAGLTDSVALAGAVSNEEIGGCLDSNHLLVVPSRYEALGIVYLEAMACGLPVIATAAGGAHEIVRHGEVGFLTPPGDAETLAGYLRRIQQQPEQLLEMSLAAYHRSRAHPTWQQSFLPVRDYLQSLAGNRGRSWSVQTVERG